MVHLERSMELATMENGVKLIGKALVNKNLNKWGVRNILRTAWKQIGNIEIKWVRENTFIITVQNESTATKILNQVPWAVMKQNLSVQRWLPELALEKIQLELVPFWVQIHRVPLYLCLEVNVRRLVREIGEFLKLENPFTVWGFLRVKVVVNTLNPLITGC